MTEGIPSPARELDASMGALAAVPRVAGGGATAVRPARDADAQRLTDIYNFYVERTAITFDLEPQTVEQRREWMSHYGETGRHRLFVAERDGVVLGFTASSRFHPRPAYDTTVETTIVCAPEGVGLGIGGRLYAALFDAIRREDVHLLVALVTMPNAGSAALHERFGYERAMTLPEAGRKFGRWWDVAWFVRRGW
jgi:phosphinothricin acetyltransferase